MADKHQSKSIMDSSCKIHVTNLKKNFGKLEVLKDISLDVAEGEVVVLLGPSGSGKSTLLRCLNQLETATSGQIIIDGHDVTDRHTDINKVRENIGMVFQHFNLFNHLTVMDNMTLAPVHLKLATKEEIEQIKKYAFAVNDVLKAFWSECGVTLVDFKLEFGRTSGGAIVLADEISPDTCRLWDSKTHEKLDKDRFRRDLGGVEDAYSEIMRRLLSHDA